MNRSLVRALSIAFAAGPARRLRPACGSSDDALAGARTSFQLTDAGCARTTPKAPAGHLRVENAGQRRR